MKANCKRWKCLLFIMAAAAAFTASPVSTEAAGTQESFTSGKPGSEQKATSDKMNSEVSIVGSAAAALGRDQQSLTTAGAADILDANISMEKEELIAFAKRSAKAEKKEKSTLVMAKVNEFVNMRQDADQDAEKVGVLYKDCGGEIVEQIAGWTKVKSGDVTGWIKNDYLYFDEEAKNIAKDVGMLTAYSETETLRVRMDADLESGVLGLLANGEAVEAIAEEGDWVSVNYEGTKGYVAKEYVKVVFDIDKAESMAVIKAREEAERARAAAAAEAKRIAQKEAVMATASEVDILAALIQCEAGGEPYEGQVAVGAVVMNRVRSGGYPNTITDVIYASGQFVPASKGKMESLILNGTTKASCRQAANEAINGACNVGDALHFRRNNGRAGLVIGNHVFY